MVVLGSAIFGVNPVIVGTALEPTTVKAPALVADPVGVVTLIGPVVAPTSTEATIRVALAEITLANAPLKLTVFWLAVMPNPVPETVTIVPVEPLPGVNSITATDEELWREMERRLPTPS